MGVAGRHGILGSVQEFSKTILLFHNMKIKVIKLRAHFIHLEEKGRWYSG